MTPPVVPGSSSQSGQSHGQSPSQHMTPAEVALWLRVDRGWVYAHAALLGARRLGTGPKARLRFDRAAVEAWLASCSGSREPVEAKPAANPMIRRRRRPAALGTNAPLLPIRARSDVREAA